MYKNKKEEDEKKEKRIIRVTSILLVLTWEKKLEINKNTFNSSILVVWLYVFGFHSIYLKINFQFFAAYMNYLFLIFNRKRCYIVYFFKSLKASSRNALQPHCNPQTFCTWLISPIIQVLEVILDCPTSYEPITVDTSAFCLSYHNDKYIFIYLHTCQWSLSSSLTINSKREVIVSVLFTNM